MTDPPKRSPFFLPEKSSAEIPDFKRVQEVFMKYGQIIQIFEWVVASLANTAGKK